MQDGKKVARNDVWITQQRCKEGHEGPRCTECAEHSLSLRLDVCLSVRVCDEFLTPEPSPLHVAYPLLRCTECEKGTASDKINKVPDGSCLPCDPGFVSPVHLLFFFITLKPRVELCKSL